jgi:hypothetical protein
MNLGRQACFLEQHANELRIRHQMWVHHLDGEQSLESACATEAREQYGAHPAARDLGE